MDEAQPGAAAVGASIKVPLFSAGRERTGEIELAAAVFGRIGHNSLLHEAVRMQLAKRRAGTASTWRATMAGRSSVSGRAVSRTDTTSGKRKVARPFT